MVIHIRVLAKESEDFGYYCDDVEIFFVSRFNLSTARLSPATWVIPCKINMKN